MCLASLALKSSKEICLPFPSKFRRRIFTSLRERGRKVGTDKQFLLNILIWQADLCGQNPPALEIYEIRACRYYLYRSTVINKVVLFPFKCPTCGGNKFSTNSVCSEKCKYTFSSTIGMESLL